MTTFAWTNVADNFDDVLATHLNNLAAGVFDAMQGLRPGGRLTLTSGTPVTTADVTGATNVYYCPYLSNLIALWDGTDWTGVVFAEKTLALGTLTSALPHDVFGYLSAGDLALEKLAWTNTTTRATAITLQDGRYCKSGDKTRLYLGTFYTTSTTQTEDSVTKRFLFNAYNRVARKLKKTDSTANWTYSTASWRSWNNSTANRVEFVIGLAENNVVVSLVGLGNNSVGASMSLNLGLDSTSSPSADTYAAAGSSVATSYIRADYSAPVAVGYHYLQAIEQGGSSGTTTFYGVLIPYLQAGLLGEVWA